MPRRSIPVKRLLFAFLLLTVAAACAVQRPLYDTEALKAAYMAAVKDAETAEPHEICRDLVAIVPCSSDLVWRHAEGADPLVLVVTWTDYRGYDDKVGQQMVLGREVWVTTVPEVRQFAGQINGDPALRLEQLLGLPPHSGKTRFVELWVKPGDLFRPSADPEISDHESELDFPVSSRFVSVSPSHKDWYNRLKQVSYGEQGYPWTRLGYTYDWGRDDHIGLSEFVVAKGAVVTVHSVTPTARYGH